MRIYSLLPWVKIITPLGQEQFPEKSKETLQVPDYEIVFEAGSNTIFSIVRNVFHIVDTVRRKCGGEKFYLMPYHINDITTEMIELQFGKVPHIFNVYLKGERREGLNVLVSHDG